MKKKSDNLGRDYEFKRISTESFKNDKSGS